MITNIGKVYVIDYYIKQYIQIRDCISMQFAGP